MHKNMSTLILSKWGAFLQVYAVEAESPKNIFTKRSLGRQEEEKQKQPQTQWLDAMWTPREIEDPYRADTNKNRNAKQARTQNTKQTLSGHMKHEHNEHKHQANTNTAKHNHAQHKH